MTIPTYRGVILMKTINPEAMDNIVHLRPVRHVRGLCGMVIGTQYMLEAQDWPVTCIKCLVIYEADL